MAFDPVGHPPERPADPLEGWIEPTLWLAQAAMSGMSSQAAENVTTAVSVQPKDLIKRVFPASGVHYRACQAIRHSTPCRSARTQLVQRRAHRSCRRS